ncbi:MAG: phosphoglucosamine mutase [Eubacteriaceae bacterium]|nr:phosphoglucosamine mutase [Eubacteriaceae bacterium]
MAKYFGTDGFRGEANKDLTAKHAFDIGRFLGWYYGAQRGKRAKIVIGKDTRLSSYMYECALTAGLTASGADAYLMHVTTTPSVSHIARTDGFDCGIMISASHNPYTDNGIKLINCQGEKMDDATIDEVEKYLEGIIPEPPYAVGEEIGRAIDYAEGRNRYIAYLISIGTHSFKGMKVALDCANGSTWQIAGSVFNALGAQTYIINNRPDGTNINTKCGSTHIEGLIEYVKQNNCDVGFAFDGDADRCLACDEEGNIVDGDKIMYICAKYMQEKGEMGQTKVVTTVMSNIGLYKALDKLNIGYEKTAVGDKYVYENMRENGHNIGGEQSGHIIFGKYANTGDGLLTALKVMQVMMDTKSSLSSLASPVTIYPQVLKNCVVTDKATAQKDPLVAKRIEQVEKSLAGEGRVLVRPSGTEPVLRIMAEAPTDEECEKAVDEVIAALEESGKLVEVRK